MRCSSTVSVRRASRAPSSSMRWPGTSGASSAGAPSSPRWGRRSAAARAGSCSPGRPATASSSISGPRTTPRRLRAGGRFWRSTCTSIPTTSTSVPRLPPTSTLSCRQSAGPLPTGSTGTSGRRPELRALRCRASSHHDLPRFTRLHSAWCLLGHIKLLSEPMGTDMSRVGTTAASLLPLSWERRRSCGGATKQRSQQRERTMRKTVHLTLALLAVGLASPALADEADWQEVEKALGVSGSMEPGDVYKVSLPRSDLEAIADGVQIKPSFALSSWLAFKQAGEHTMVMGDLVLTADEVNPVISKLEEGGIQVTALHHHLDNLTPDVLFMHVGGEGDPIELAEALHAGLAMSKTPLGKPSAKAAAEELPLDTAELDQIMGRQGKASGGVYHFTVARAEEITEVGMVIPSAMGTATAINFQPTG